LIKYADTRHIRSFSIDGVSVFMADALFYIDV
jgi:hypothetical protein